MKWRLFVDGQFVGIICSAKEVARLKEISGMRLEPICKGGALLAESAGRKACPKVLLG